MTVPSNATCLTQDACNAAHPATAAARASARSGGWSPRGFADDLTQKGIAEADIDANPGKRRIYMDTGGHGHFAT